MWLSLNIVSRIVDIKGLAPEEIARRLTMSSAEIDGIEYMNAHMKSVITVKLTDVRPHPNADKLTLCDCFNGKETLRVVCGAPNHKKGDIVALATIGTKFNEEFTVKKTKIRGEESTGMLCSEKELGISDDHSGIMVLPADTPLGKPMSELYADMMDVRLEIDNKSITHRPDLWSHIGFAREIGALFNRKFTDIINYSLTSGFKDVSPFKVTIKNPDGAPRYCGLAVRNITIKESPAWLKAMVTSIGMRPINNIVDVTNYVMAEVGEPMHAFDRKKLRGNEIIVRFAENGENMKTLDGQDHILCAEDVVIADQGGAIAVAGVMGGGNSEIEDGTTEIILEAANFNPVSIRKTAGRYGMRTEAAVRFEKSIDPEACPAALIRCYDLIRQILPDAEPVSTIVDTYPVKFEKKSITTSTDFIRKKLGHDLPDDKITGILESLDFSLKRDGSALVIGVPSYRATKDISIPDDIVEEVGRIYGYDNIPSMPPFVPCAPPDMNAKRSFERRIKTILSRNHNLTEVSNYSFVGESVINRLGTNQDGELRLKNPLSSEQDRLRRSLVPNMIGNIQLNQRNFEQFGIYELGRVYLKPGRQSGDLATENTRVTCVLFRKKSDSLPFFDAKSIVMDLCGQLKLKNVSCVPRGDALPPYAHPGRSAEILIDGAPAGLVFELHPATMETFEVRGRVAMFDLDMDAMLNAKTDDTSFIELQKYPEVPFEVSVLCDRFTYAQDICSIIAKSSRDFIRSIEVLSVYEGDPVPAGKKSVSIKLVMAAAERTLGPDEIDKLQKKVIADLNAKGYQLR
jgi:phenylalanyl-tRNA synthetase beta chain